MVSAPSSTNDRLGAALVTGAGTGIGRAVAYALAADGWAVVATDVDGDAADRVADGIRRAGGRARADRLDIVDEAAWKAVHRRIVDEEGDVELLVNNAGIRSSRTTGDGDLIDLALATFDQMIAVNLRGAVIGTKLVLPAMRSAGRGSVVMMSSAVSMQGVPGGGTAYAVSKAGLNALVRSVAVTYGRDGIRCNAVAPGFVVDDDQADKPLTGLLEVAARSTGRAGTTTDIAGVVAFLASPRAAYINGQALLVDGGLTTHLVSANL